MAKLDKSTIVADTAGLLSLARDLHQSGQFKAAEALFKQAASQVTTMLGPRHVFLANILAAYAEFLSSVQRGAEAAAFREQSNRSRERPKPSAT
jgi:hypothetical protein